MFDDQFFTLIPILTELSRETASKALKSTGKVQRDGLKGSERTGK